MSFLKGATVGFDTENNKAVYVDQTLLPDNYVEKSADEIEDMCGAVKKLKVRGAPAIGVFAAISLAVLMNKSAADNKDSFLKEMELYANELVSCRPTAVNLKWAADRMLELARLSHIDKVQFLVEGKKLDMLGNIDLSQPLEARTSIADLLEKQSSKAE